MKETKSQLWLEKTLGFKGFIEYIHNAELMITTIKPLTSIPYTLTINKTERFVLLEPTKVLFGKPCWSLQKGYPLSIRMKMVQTNFPILVKDNTENEILEKETLLKNTIDVIKDSNINETIEKSIVKKEIDELNIDIFDLDKINEYIESYQLNGKKAINSKTKQYTKGFNEFLKEKLESEKDTILSIESERIDKIVLEKAIIPMYHTSQDFQTYTQSGYNEVVLGKHKITINQVVLYVLSILLTIFVCYSVFSNIYNAEINSLKGI